MSVKTITPSGHPIPNTSQHTVIVNQPDWTDVEAFATNPRLVVAGWKSGYPRLKIHEFIANLATAVLKHLNIPNKSCVLFSSLQSVNECLEFCTSPRRDHGSSSKPIPRHALTVYTLRANDSFYAITFPPDNLLVVMTFWREPGVGISSRFAEANLAALDQLAEVKSARTYEVRSAFDTAVHEVLRQRIAHHLARAPLHPTQQQPRSSDVYLFPTGMASIYKSHSCLRRLNQGTTILFGMSFTSTISLFQEFGFAFKFFGNGTEDELNNLEIFLAEERKCGRKIQDIWAEFPANPLLVTPDLVRLRELADEYDAVLAIDNTISSFANVDILDMTDMLVASLSKSFNGNADLLAGSVVLNPESRKYLQLKVLFDESYVPELYIADAEAMEINSRDYLSRTDLMNHNARALVNYLSSCAEDPGSAVRKVYYPSVSPSGKHFQQFMRPVTSEFTPGYGCLFSVEFRDLPTTVAFYDSLNLYKSPHLGAPWTLAFAYTVCLYGTKLDWAARYGLRPTQIRFTAGSENTVALISEFKSALEVANQVRSAS